MKARRNMGANGLRPARVVVKNEANEAVKFEPNQSPLTARCCRISEVGAHGIGRQRISPSQARQSVAKTLGGDSLVVLEQPAEPLTTANIAKR